MTDMPFAATADKTSASDTQGLWARLKSGTRTVHESLDNRIMSAQPFADLDRYGALVLVHHDFHSLVSPLFQDEALARVLPDLSDRDRLDKVREDLNDLGIAVPPVQTHAADENLDIATAVGWLYAAEGSNLGAAFLFKAAEKLGLSENYGARHLAGAPEGRARHWKSFTTALDALDLGPEGEQQAIAGANAAFARVRESVEQRFFAGND